MDFAHLHNIKGVAMGVRWQRAPVFGVAVELTHGLHEPPWSYDPQPRRSASDNSKPFRASAAFTQS